MKHNKDEINGGLAEAKLTISVRYNRFPSNCQDKSKTAGSLESTISIVLTNLQSRVGHRLVKVTTDFSNVWVLRGLPGNQPGFPRIQ